MRKAEILRRWGILFLSAVILGGCGNGRISGPAGPAAGREEAPETVSFDRIRVAFSTTADWARMELLDSRNVLAMRVISVPSLPGAGWGATNDFLVLNQSADAARAVRRLTMIADYALSLDARDKPLEFQLQRGSINESVLEISRIGDDGERRLVEIIHGGADEAGTGLNSKYVSVDLRPLWNFPPLTARIGLGDGKTHRWEFAGPEIFSSAETALLRIREARNLGIEGFFLDWPGSSRVSEIRLKETLDVAARENFRISFHFEVTDPAGGPILDENRIREELTEAVNLFGEHPAVPKVDGRPMFAVPIAGPFSLETWRRVFATLEDRGVAAAALAVGLAPADFELYFDADEGRIFPYPGAHVPGPYFVRKAGFYGLHKDAGMPPIWITTIRPRFARFGRESRLLWEIRF